MRTKIKICGIKNLHEVEIINKFPIDYIGFIFAKSPRQITIETAEMMVKSVRDEIKIVGVFVDESDDVILDAIKRCNLNAVQLHRTASKELIQEIRTQTDAKIWQVVSVKDKEDIDKAISIADSVDKILLDTFSSKVKGGSGKVFDWRLLEEINIKDKIILAGGINPDNARYAVEKIAPYMIDVNSGVEVDLIKDEVKIIELFINIAK